MKAKNAEDIMKTVKTIRAVSFERIRLVVNMQGMGFHSAGTHLNDSY